MTTRSSENVLFVTLDSCRFDTFRRAARSGLIPSILSVAPYYKAKAPSYFTYGSHASFWMGFTPGVESTDAPCLNPKAGKVFKMAHAGLPGIDHNGYCLDGQNIIDGFRRRGFLTIGSGAVDWFDPNTETGAVLGHSFEQFKFSGNTWSLRDQLEWILAQISSNNNSRPVFCFLNIGETHVPYWHEGADWPRWPSPCIPFGGKQCSAQESARRQLSCLAWVDGVLKPLIDLFMDGTVLICADHGDCWGEDGLWEHGISHPATLNVPLLLRVRGEPITAPPPRRKRLRLLEHLRGVLFH